MRSRVVLSAAGATLAVFCYLLVSLFVSRAALGQGPGNLQVFDLTTESTPETLAAAQAGFEAGTAILRVSSGTEGDIQRLLGVPLLSATVKSAATEGARASDNDLEKLAPSRLRAAAAYKDKQGVVRSAMVFAGSPGVEALGRDAWQKSLDVWVAHEQARASGNRVESSDPEPPGEAWTTLYRSTVITNSGENDNQAQLTLGVFRLNSISSSSDYYMVATVAQTTPHFSQCGPFICDYHMLSQEVRIGPLDLVPAGESTVVDHGPASTVNSRDTTFDVGLGLSKDGPGGSVGFSQTWSTPDVNTSDLSDAKRGRWLQQVQFALGAAPCKPVIGGVPGASKDTFFTKQAVIFEVPVNTTGITLPVNFDSDFCSYDLTRDGLNPRHDATAIGLVVPLGAPVLQAYPLAITIPSGGTRTLVVGSYIPGSNEGFSWTATTNQTWAPPDSQGPFSTGRLLPITITPGTQDGSQAVISINTDPKYAAPAVRNGPIEVHVTVGPAKQSEAGGILLAGGINPGGILQHNSQVFDYGTNLVYTTGPPSVERYQHTATLLQDGRILLAGGATRVGNGKQPVTTSAEIFDPATLQYSKTGDLNTARRSHAAIRLPDGKVLISGGYDENGKTLDTAELYDPAAGKFAIIGHTMRASRSFHYANLISTSGSAKVLLYAGEGDDADGGPAKPLKSAEVWDESTGVFTAAADMPFALNLFPPPVPSPKGNWVTAGGLLDGNVSTRELGITLADPPTIASDPATLNYARFEHTLTTLAKNGGLLATGGSADYRSTPTDSAELRDASGWTLLPSKMTARRLLHTATLLPDGRVFIAGGFPESSSTSTEFYDPASKAFTSGPSIIGRYGHTATLFSSSVTTLAVSPSTAVFGQSVNLSAQVSTAFGTSGGTIQFLDGSTLLGSVPLSNGQANYAYQKFSLGTHTLSAIYSGDDINAQSTSQTVMLAVGAADSSLSISSSPNPSQLGQPVTFSIAVQAAAGSGLPPTGDVTLTEESVTLGTIKLDGGKGALTTGVLTAGAHKIKAAYSGDAAYKAASQTIDQNVTKQSSVTTIAATPSTPIFGQTITFTSKVTLATRSLRLRAGPFTGTVVFKDGDSTLGQAAVTGGSAQFTTSALGAGKHSITATYTGDAEADASSSDPLSVTVAQAGTSTALQSSANPSQVGESVTFSAHVTSAAGVPSGSVLFSDGAKPIGSARTLVNGVADLSTAALAAGSHLISAAYSGSDSFTSSASPAVQQRVDAATTTTQLQSSPNPSSPSQVVSFTATVSSPLASVTGHVTFYDGPAAISPAVPLAGGAASFSTSSLATGSHDITAHYAGDAQHAASTSAVLTQKVVQVKVGTSTSLSGSPNPSALHGLVKFQVEVVPSSGKAVPAGQVTLKNGNATLAVLPISAGTAAFSTSELNAGQHSITAVYTGDSDFLGSSSAPFIQMVQGTIQPDVVMQSSRNPSVAGEAVTFTTTVSAPGHPVPTGSIEVSEDLPGRTVSYGIAVLVNGVAKVTTTKLTVGTHAIRATYGGDASLYSGNTSAPVYQEVTAGNGN